jgi:hypothetical protein
MKKHLPILGLSIALIAPTYALAQDHDNHQDERRYHDAKHNDDHVWNAHEDRAYHIYWEQQHRKYVDWDHLSERQRQSYWDWRHNHSDAVLNINIR